MNIQWEPKIGVAAVISFVGALSMLVSLGVVWGKTATKIDNLATKVDESTQSIDQIQKEAKTRDDKISGLSERTGRIENALTFMVPALTRIESKLDTPVRR